MKTEDRQARRARRIFWAYNRIWVESRLLLAFLFGGTLVYTFVRDTGNGRFRLDIFLPVTLFFLLFLLFPLSCWRFMMQGWQDIQKRRIAVKDISVFSCGDDKKHIMQSRGADVEKYRKLCVVDQDLKKYYCCVARNVGTASAAFLWSFCQIPALFTPQNERCASQILRFFGFFLF